MSNGIYAQPICDTPIAVIDFETTGLTPGTDRVVEVSVVRVDPGEEPRLVFDTLVNPQREVAATEIHGITDSHVADAPDFCDIAGELVAHLNGCAIAAYNVYFDMRFLKYEMEIAGVEHEPPYFCLMYLRPLLRMGSRCSLEEACAENNIQLTDSHRAADDALASGLLMKKYLATLQKRNITTFKDLATHGNYKFLQSFTSTPYPEPGVLGLNRCEQVVSRKGFVPEKQIDPEQQAIREYWDILKTVLADLTITDEELKHVLSQRSQLGLPKEKIRVLHARAFVSIVAQFCSDEWLDDAEVKKLQRLRHCLAQLGWAPGD